MFHAACRHTRIVHLFQYGDDTTTSSVPLFLAPPCIHFNASVLFSIGDVDLTSII
jgi:hypothetical protein